MAWNIETIRGAFPALAITDAGVPRRYLDAPAGSQVAGRVVDAMRDAMIGACANDGGAFRTSVAAGSICDAAQAGAAAFYNCAADEIVFGLNTTSLFFQFAGLLSADWREGDNILLSRMDHDANVAPWLQAAQARDVEVRWLEWDRESFEFRYEMLDLAVDARTRLVAVGHASNMLGTLNDVARVCAAARNVGAVSVVDAVQSAPHIAIDVAAIGCDMLSASAYKFFGPHAAALFVSRDCQARLPSLKVRPSSSAMPTRLSPGTPSFEAQAGTLAAIEHYGWLGELAGADAQAPLRTRILAGCDAMVRHETDLMRHFLAGLGTLRGVTLHGIANPNRLASRVPTFTMSIAGHAASDVAAALAARNIFAWDGYYYAWEPAGVLGLREAGALRVGLSHYNSMEEVDVFLEALADITG